jgi:hypothetical protein
MALRPLARVRRADNTFLEHPGPGAFRPVFLPVSPVQLALAGAVVLLLALLPVALLP